MAFPGCKASGLAASPPSQKHNGVKSNFRVPLSISGNQAFLHNQAASAIEVQEGRSARTMIQWIIVSVGRAAAPLEISWCRCTRDEPPMTACGGILIGGEFSRNEQSLLWRVATIEAADRIGPRPVVN